MANQERGKVILLATGGTIAGVGAAGKSVAYEPGQVSVNDLIEAVPMVSDVAHIETYQICNVNSDDITDQIWLELARIIDRLALDPAVTGFVVTHGTDTMAETAYFLNLVLKTDKPVVLTGSMRPATAISADGPMNLYQAVVTAAHPESRGAGVLVAFSGRLYNARDVQKTSTYDVGAMSGGENGSCGVVRDDKVLYSSRAMKRHTVASEFSVSGLTRLPRVTVLYFNIDADPELATYAASISDGLVIASAGAGGFSKSFQRALEQVSVPVVISSRVGSGVIMGEATLLEGGIAANDLPPQKAAILLRLALTRTTDRDEIAHMFETY